MKHFFIITNPFKDRELETTTEVMEFLADKGCTYQVKIAAEIQEESNRYTDAAEIPADTECILVLGGDGTLIEAARDTSPWYQSGEPGVFGRGGEVGYPACPVAVIAGPISDGKPHDAGRTACPGTDPCGKIPCPE